MTTLTLGYRSISNRLKSIHLPQVQWKSLLWVACFAFFAALVAYVILVNQLTRGAFLVKDYNRQMDKLTEQSKDLETTFAQTGFMGDVQTRAALLNFEKTTKVTYVQILDQSVSMVK